MAELVRIQQVVDDVGQFQPPQEAGLLFKNVFQRNHVWNLKPDAVSFANVRDEIVNQCNDSSSLTRIKLPDQ